MEIKKVYSISIVKKYINIGEPVKMEFKILDPQCIQITHDSFEVRGRTNAEVLYHHTASIRDLFSDDTHVIIDGEFENNGREGRGRWDMTLGEFVKDKDTMKGWY